jgi:hypothetical protein
LACASAKRASWFGWTVLEHALERGAVAGEAALQHRPQNWLGEAHCARGLSVHRESEVGASLGRLEAEVTVDRRPLDHPHPEYPIGFVFHDLDTLGELFAPGAR